MTNQAVNFGEMAMSLCNQADELATVETALKFAVEVLHYDAASVMLVHRRKLVAAAATDPLVTVTDELQIDLGEGPSVVAATDGGTVRVDDTIAEERWPKWASIAAANGSRSALAIRMSTARSTSGVLNLVSAQPRVFEVGDLEAAGLLALHASIAIASARTEASLREAIDSGKEVGQAVGRVMERYRLDAAGAFAVLRRCSQDRNQRLRQVAQHVIATGKLPD